MVVGHFRANSYKLDLYLVDFTVNPQPYSYSKNKEYSDKKIQCTLWDNHAENCPPILKGDFVQITHVVKKLVNGALTMNVHRSKPDECFVSKLKESDASLVDLLNRKRVFDDEHKRQSTAQISSIDSQGQPSSSSTTIEQGSYAMDRTQHNSIEQTAPSKADHPKPIALPVSNRPEQIQPKSHRVEQEVQIQSMTSREPQVNPTETPVRLLVPTYTTVYSGISFRKKQKACLIHFY
ncbi:hypothetical protein BY458DRAFT_150057 [Sporodiniella umbellata]|nr:hypothetical protein BY458DRAFT_150057 [Sporodiniella umbellata]